MMIGVTDLTGDLGLARSFDLEPRHPDIKELEFWRYTSILEFQLNSFAWKVITLHNIKDF
jgi:hypothetical protein